MSADAPKYTFQYLDGKKFNALEGKQNREYLLKWSMKDRIKAQTFSYDQEFQAYQKEDFVKAFFEDPTVISSLQVQSSSGKWTSLGIKAKEFTAEPLTSSELSMSFFDRLYEHKIVRENGAICKCFDEFFQDFTISDELRKCLLIEDSDNFDVFSDSDRQEFLFCLFRHFCLGGQVCQYEDNVQPYLDITKLVYKDLVSVQKDPKSGDLFITSVVFKVTASDDSDKFFPSDRDHEQDFAYLIVDPLKRHVTTLYHNFGTASFD